MKKIIFRFLMLNLFQHSANAQDQHLIDSLQTIFKTTMHDTTKVNILYEISKANWYANPDTALYYAKQSLALSEHIGFVKGTGFANYSMGVINVFNKNYQTAMEFTKKAQKIGGEIRDKQLIASTYVNLGVVNIRQVNYPEALTNLFEALKIAKEIKNKQIVIWSYINIATIYYSQGKYPEALKIKFTSLKIEEEIGDKPGVAASYNIIGDINYLLGKYPEALKYHINAIKIQEEIGDKLGRAYTYCTIGIIYDNLGDYSEALKNYLASLKIYTELENKDGRAALLTDIGETYRKQGNYPIALKNYFASLKLYDELDDKIAPSVNLSNIGLIYFEQGNYPEAFKNSFAALEMAEENGDKQVMAYTNVNIGNIYSKLKEFLEASQYLNKGLSISKEIGSLDIIKQSYDGLATMDSTKGNFKQALEHYKLFISYRDSLVNKENTKKITQQQMQYDFDKKEAITKGEQQKKDALSIAEIKRQTLIKDSTLGGVGIIGIFSFLLVRTSNRKKKTVFDKQVSEVEMKALRSQMNPHFIFNALQSVNDFILKKDTMNASNFLVKFSKLMRSVLENSVHKEVTIEKDIASLELYMQLESSRLDFPFDYEIIIDPKIDPETTFIPPLILQPFVENSIWHGLKHKKEKGKIKIEIKEAENSILCSIEDNGVGREKANTLKQPMPEKKESLGMKLTKERLRILEQVKNFRSRIDIIDLKDGLNNPLGLRIELSLPLATLN